MEQSETITKLAEALMNFQRAVQPIKRTGINPHFKSSYATLEDMIEGTRELLAKNSLAYAQLPHGEDELTTVLMHTSGEYIKATAKMRLAQNTAQGQGSAMTYMRRYALGAILGIATEEDDDGNAASAKPVVVQRAAPHKTNGNKVDAAKELIRKATTVDRLLTLANRIKVSAEFSDSEKQELDKLLQNQEEIISPSQ